MRRTIAALSLASLAMLGGCSSTHPKSVSMGEFGQAPTILSLGAGDSLGRSIYVNDLILAAVKIDQQTTYTNVDLGTTDVLFDPRY